MNSNETKNKTIATGNGTYRGGNKHSHAQTIPPTFDEYPEMLTIAEACKALGVDGYTMHKLLENDMIRIDKDNIAWLIPRASLVAYVMENPHSAFGRSPGNTPGSPADSVWGDGYADDEI